MSGQPENTQPNTRQLTPEMEARKWQPGQSGNPGGRPKRKPITEMFERILANEQNAEEIQEAVRQIFNQKSGMAKVLLLEKMAERLEGKVSQPVDANVNVNLSISERLRRAEQRLSSSK